MDDAHEVRAELRNYALRRCIRFYTALVIVAIATVGSVLAPPLAGWSARVYGAILLVVIACVEGAAFLVMRDMAAARDRLGGGPETPLWRLAQGHWPGAAGIVLYLAAAALLFFSW